MLSQEKPEYIKHLAPGRVQGMVLSSLLLLIACPEMELAFSASTRIKLKL